MGFDVKAIDTVLRCISTNLPDRVDNLPDSEALCGVEPRTVGAVESFGKLWKV